MILLYMVTACYNIYISLNMGLILDKFQVGDSLNAIISLCIGGFVGAAFNGYIVKRLRLKKKFKFMLQVNTILSSILFFLFNICLAYKLWYFILVVLFFSGFTVMPIITLAIEYAVQISYPVGEALSAGLLTMVGMLCSPIFTLFSSYFQENTVEL